MNSKKAPLSKEYLNDIKEALNVLHRGGVILYPTDTIWGLGCDATNAEAVKRIYAIKRRNDAKALISLVDSETKVQAYVKEVPEVAWDVMELSERPITIIFDGARNLAPNLLAPDGSAALRITKEAFSKELCMRFKKAIVSTSANISGEPSPQSFEEISDEIKASVDYICTSRQNETSLPAASSIIKLGAGGEITIIRM
jgi:L-threonylcarbamoyladenylate synthase